MNSLHIGARKFSISVRKSLNVADNNGFRDSKSDQECILMSVSLQGLIPVAGRQAIYWQMAMVSSNNSCILKVKCNEKRLKNSEKE
jgi:hypothetical protein